MYLYVEAKIAGELVKITSLVTGILNASNVTYTLYPTIVFLENEKLVCNAVEENGDSRVLVYYNETCNYGSSDIVLRMEKVKTL